MNAPTLPPPGWYPDPSGAGIRYWNGQNWTDHYNPRGVVAGATAVPAWQTGMPVPTTGALAASGLRRLNGLFSDMGQILKRGWRPILGLSLLLWVGWTIVSAVVLAGVLNYGNLGSAVSATSSVVNKYGDATVPAAVGEELRRDWESVLRSDSVLTWVLVSMVILVLLIATSAVQVAAANRVAVSATANSAPQEEESGAGDDVIGAFAAIRSAWRPGIRLLGYLLVATIAIAAVGLAWAFVIAALAQLGGGFAFLAGVVAFLGLLAMIAGMYWLMGRLAPVLVQVTQGPGSVRWSWQATKGKFWAVFGRMLLWSVVASLIVQLVVTALLVPVYAILFIGGAMGNAGLSIGAGIVLVVLVGPVSLSLSIVSTLGVVPIWRDLTTDERYRAIPA
ncbi:MAG: DUF2510 domain-containing protein [Actinomycetia bacterium]|nr:DUF2510 domain-containing protein [Actinomycetes bacterium]